MKVTHVETVYCADLFPPFIFVQLHTDEGLIGLGQTADARSAPIIHDMAQRFVLGKDPLHVENLWWTMFGFAAYHGYAGAELRAISALDIALWDLLGQVAGLPIYALLGGAVRDQLRIYNTCSHYNDYDDTRLLREQPEKLINELLEDGISILKFSAWDNYVRANRGQPLTPEQIREGLQLHETIQRISGGQMDVMIDMHGLWTLPDATTLAHALETSGFPLHWMEDPLWQDSPRTWADLRSRTRLRLAGSERLMTRFQMQPMLDAHGTDIWISDITWTGGISEFKKMATLAETYGIPMAAHDHSGPVNLYASAHVLLNIPNAYLMETSRVFYNTYYREVVEGEPIIRHGQMHLPQGAGLGIRLRKSVLDRPDATIRRTSAT